jgi:uncharacterized repeat protein (TIGR02543 family)
MKEGVKMINKIFKLLIIIIISFFVCSCMHDVDNQNIIVITYETNGGVLPSGIEKNTQVIIGVNNVLPIPVKTGYRFLGWYHGDSETSERFNNIQSFEANSIIYARWEKNAYTISFETDGGNGIQPLTEIHLNSIVDLPTPTKTDYIFDGWFLNDVLIQTPYEYVNESDIVLTAKWKPLEEIFTFEYSYNTVYIKSYNGSYENLVIPKTINGIEVKYIFDSAFQDCKSLVSMVLPDSITNIGANAFQYCNNLESINLPDSLNFLCLSHYLGLLYLLNYCNH